ncbi:type III pantothenate kinase, partial [Faecalibacterium sp. DFI.5.82]|nr:type III pantothenate kinase [Faecalibacterium sp. DFI.5.82]
CRAQHRARKHTALSVHTNGCFGGAQPHLRQLGTAVLLDGITQRIEEELGRPATLVVTGGLAKYVTPLCRHPLTYDPKLLLKGLALLYQMNAPQPHYAAG